MKRLILPAFLLLASLGLAHAQSDAPPPPDGPPQGERGGHAPKGIAGAVTAISGNSFAIQSRDGQSLTVNFTTETAFLTPEPPPQDGPPPAPPTEGQRQGPPPNRKLKAIQASEIKVGDRILVQGPQTSGIVAATRILLLPKHPGGGPGGPGGPGSGAPDNH